MNLNEMVEQDYLTEVSTAVVERDATRYLWAIQELGYAATLPNVTMVIGTAMAKGIDVELMLGLVAGESSWRADVMHSNGGSNDYGLFQLNNLWHNQHKGSIVNHIKAGIDHFKWCLKAEKGNVRRALSRYNTGGGDSAAGRKYASYILGKKDEASRKVRQYPRYVARQASRGNRIR